MNGRHGFAVLLISTLQATVALAQPEAARQPPGPFQAVLDRIHVDATSDAAKQGTLRDERIEAWLDQALASLAKETKITDLKLPVRLADLQTTGVQPRRPGAFGGQLKTLLVGKYIDQSGSLQNCVVFADGHARLGKVEGCVIIAQGTVSLESARNSVIAAGQCVAIASGDGERRNPANGSVIVTPGWVSIDEAASGTLIVAHGGAFVWLTEDVFFINSPPAASEQGSSKSLTIADFPLEVRPAHPIAAKLKGESVVRVDAKRERDRNSPLRNRNGMKEPFGVVFRHGDRRYMATINEAIVDESGRPVESLRDWKVTKVIESLAIFSNGTTEVAVRIAGNP